MALSLLTVGVLGYLLRGEIASAFAGTQEGSVATLGLGVAPVGLWAAVLLGVVVWRRRWLRRINVWVGSLVYVALVLGVLSFFHPDQGSLAAFTTDFDDSLGGNVGDAIAGDMAWLGALRLFALFAVGTAIAVPRLSLELLVGLGRGLVVVYAAIALAVSGLFSVLRRMYRFDEQGAAEDSTTGHSESEALRRALAAATRHESSRSAEEQVGTAEGSGVASGDSTEWREVTPLAEMPVYDLLETEPASPPVQDPRAEESVPGRYNKFWSKSTQTGEASNGSASGHDVGPGHGNEAEVPPSPVSRDVEVLWRLPRRELIRDADEGGISDEEMTRTSETIKQTLAEYSVEVEMGQVKPGPTVTMYGLIPGWVRRYKQVKETDEEGRPKLDQFGKPIVSRAETKTRVKVDSIISREKDLSLALKTPSIRIETPVLGESLVGIEVPNPTPSMVTLRRVMESDEFGKLRSIARLPIALGKGSGGESVVVDLANMPHLLVAGATGSGKSVCINSIVSCLLMEKTPAEMRLLLVDPKRVELTPYNGIPHLLTPVVVETDQVVALLKGLIREMLQRYRRMEEEGVKNIDSYNRKMPEKMPYIVVAVDELADLMMSASFDVEQSLCRLAQLGRATGIHLIIATQRPSVDVVTGLIKANFPSRISFGVSSQIDSRTILDVTGADKLLGRGDMLYLAADAARPTRVQGVYISDQEIESLVDFWQTTPRGPLPQVSLHPVGDGDDLDEDLEEGDVPGSRDEFMEKAIELAQHHKKMSTSLLQRRLRIGYPRAARLMDELEDAGIVGPGDGSKSRDVIMSQL